MKSSMKYLNYRYRLGGWKNEDTCLFREPSDYDTMSYVHTDNTNALIRCPLSFLNVVELTVGYAFLVTHNLNSTFHEGNL